MAISNNLFSFDQHTTQKYDIRNRPSKYAQSPLRPFEFEQGEGIRPPVYYAPYKYLPVGFQDVNIQDYVVIPKGRVVAALSSADITVSGIIGTPSASGSIYTGFAAPEAGGAVMSAKIDSSIFGYENHIASLLVPANGGVICSGFYSADDVTAGTIMCTGAYATASGAFELPANAPIGVAFHDWYQDIRGKYLNYRMQPDGGHILTDFCVQVPYIKVAKDTTTMSGVTPQFVTNDYANLVKYRDINKIFTYLSVANADVFTNGVFVQSDLIGNYKIQGGANSLSQNKTVQTVGKIINIDNRFPKDMLDDVLTYPRSGMPGSQTAGLPKILFDFVYYTVLAGTSSAPTVEAIYDYVRSGAFGVVTIQLLVS